METILIADDDKGTRSLLKSLLTANGKLYRVLEVATGEQVLQAISEELPDLILLDVMMQGMDGFQVCQRIKADQKAKRIPILFITAREDVKEKVKGFELGGSDYITKPINQEEVLARIRTHLKIKYIEEQLRKSNEQLEICVKMRTLELVKSNEKLQKQMMERKQMVDDLRKSEEKFRVLADTAHDAIISADSSGAILYMNKQSEHMFGYEAQEVVAKPLTILMPERFHEPHRQGLKGFLSTGETRVVGKTVELMGKRKNGSEFPLELSLANWEVEGKIFFTAVIRDITERKRVEEELQNTQQHLIQIEKMESVGRLAAGVAHEIKNPLGVLQLGVDYLLKNVEVQGTSSEILRDMGQAIALADSSVKELLNFAATKALVMNLGDVNEVLDRAIHLVRNELTKHKITLVQDLGHDLPPVRIDPNRVEQALINVFLNAIQAMSNGGTLSVKSYMKKLEELGHGVGRRKTDVFKVGDQAVVAEIEDTGCGIPEANLPKLFDPFFTTKPTGQGTGLGLTVTRQIMDQHRGTIRIENRKEGGARVTLLFKAEAASSKRKD